MSTPKRIGILGGTFDPFHCGHVDLGLAAQRALELSRLYVIPANIPPHRPQTLASSFHRFAMVAQSVAGRPGWRVSDLELRSEAPSYTSVTLEHFHERGYAPAELFFVIGADAFLDIGMWKDYPGILDRAHFAVVSRPGLSSLELTHRLPLLAQRMVRPPLDAFAQVDPLIFLIDQPTANVSSTAIRQRRAAALPIDGLVPPAVQQHIEQHGLYTAMGTGRRRNDPPVPEGAGRLHGEG